MAHVFSRVVERSSGMEYSLLCKVEDFRDV